MKKTMSVTTLCVLSAAACGCNLLTPLIFIGEHKRKVPAEFDKLQGKRVLVLVWAEPETLFDYPNVRIELMSYAGDKIRAGVKDCDLVDAGRVEDFLERHLQATIDPQQTGRHFQADFVVYIELLEFQIRDISAPDLLRGRLNASVSVYDLGADPDETSRYTLSPVEILCPQNQPMLMSSRNALLIRLQTYEQFAESVARKFYQHKVDL